jgi:hypothetical protein
MSDDSRPEVPSEFVDREEFLREVEIHQSTLGRWIREGVVKPHPAQRNHRWIQLFAKKDVAFAKGVRSMQKQRHGELSLREAVAIVRGDMDQPPLGHDPSGRNPPQTPFTD